MGASGRPPSPRSPGTFEGAVVPQQLQEPLLREDPGGGTEDANPPSKQLRGWGERVGKDMEMKTTEW